MVAIERQSIPFTLTLDDECHDLALDPEPLVAYLRQNWPGILDPDVPHSFSESQMRTGIKTLMKFVVSNYVNPMVAQSDYPKLKVEKSEDYISTAAMYFVRLMLDVLAASGGIHVTVNGQSVTHVGWGEAEASPSQPA